MKRVILLLALSIISFIVIEEMRNDPAYSNIHGANPKITGSPFDVGGQTCSQSNCHSGAVTTISDVITTDVPAGGYTPGDTFTVTVAVTDETRTRFGFEISPQTSTGVLAGTILITDSPRTHFAFPTFGNKYLTHTYEGTDAPNHTAIWQFDWIAPSVGTGDVTFYSCLNFTNRDSTANGDVIHKTSLVVPENTDGIDDPLIISSLNVYPNPIVDAVQLDYYLQKSETVTIKLLDVSGKVVKELFDAKQASGTHHDAFPINGSVASGIYMVHLQAGEQTLARKVIVL